MPDDSPGVAPFPKVLGHRVPLKDLPDDREKPGNLGIGKLMNDFDRVQQADVSQVGGAEAQIERRHERGKIEEKAFRSTNQEQQFGEDAQEGCRRQSPDGLSRGHLPEAPPGVPEAEVS